MMCLPTMVTSLKMSPVEILLKRYAYWEYMDNFEPQCKFNQRDYIPPACIGSYAGGNANVGVYVGSTRLFRYQHVGISNAESSRWGSKLM